MGGSGRTRWAFDSDLRSRGEQRLTRVHGPDGPPGSSSSPARGPHYQDNAFLSQGCWLTQRLQGSSRSTNGAASSAGPSPGPAGGAPGSGRDQGTRSRPVVPSPS